MRIEDFDKIISDLKVDLLLNNREIFGLIASRIDIKLSDDNSEDCYAYTNGEQIYFYPNMFLGLTYRNIEFIIAHELMHLILNHLTRKEDKNPIIWNFACDYCVNALLKHNKTGDKLDPIGELPEGALYDIKYLDMSAEEIYDSLVEENDNRQLRMIKNKDGSIEAEDLRNKKIDEHNGVGEVSEEVQERFISEVASDIDKCAGKNTAPSCIARSISKLKKVNYNWKTILRKYMQSFIRKDTTWKRPSKRGRSMGLYLPSIKKDNTIKIGVAIDVSGSVSEEQLQELLNLIYTSLYQLINFEIYIWLFSGIVHKETLLKILPNKRENIENIKLVSNGATNIKSNIDFVNETKELNKLDLLIIMTDGFDFIETMKYDRNLLWCIIDNDGFINPKGCIKGKILHVPKFNIVKKY